MRYLKTKKPVTGKKIVIKPKAKKPKRTNKPIAGKNIVIKKKPPKTGRRILVKKKK